LPSARLSHAFPPWPTDTEHEEGETPQETRGWQAVRLLDAPFLDDTDTI